MVSKTQQALLKAKAAAKSSGKRPAPNSGASLEDKMQPGESEDHYYERASTRGLMLLGFLFVQVI